MGESLHIQCLPLSTEPVTCYHSQMRQLFWLLPLKTFSESWQLGISDKEMRAWIENRQGLKALRMAASCQNSNKNIYQLPPSLFFKAAGDSRSKILYNPSLLTATNSSLALYILFLARHRAQVTSSVTI